MAIHLECISLIVPVAAIERCVPGGFCEFLHESARFVGSLIWYDEFVCRASGAMGSADVPAMVRRWERLGLRAYDGEGDSRTWADVCVVSSFDGLRRPCPWLVVDLPRGRAWHAAHPEGELAGPPRVLRRGG